MAEEMIERGEATRNGKEMQQACVWRRTKVEHGEKGEIIQKRAHHRREIRKRNVRS